MSEVQRRRWVEPAPVKVAPELSSVVAGHRLVAETLVRRGITTVEEARSFLDPDLYQPTSGETLPDMLKAVERLERAIHNHEKIAVWGDFDVDGQTSTSLLVSALRNLGAEVVYYIPNRASEGHGMHIASLDHLLQANDPPVKVILTCDTGIAAHEAIDYVQAHEVDVLVTDHHHLPDELPNAYAMVNPKRVDEGHPLYELPGVGVAYKLIEVMYQRAGRADELEQFLDLVALGIVADVAVQVHDTRYLLQRGLTVLRALNRLGLVEILTNAAVDAERLNEEHIGFSIAPRLNALGRLDDANPSVELLTTEDREQARILAGMMERLNEERRLLTNQVVEAAENQIQRDPSLLDHAALVLAGKGWLAGVVGIAANRLVDVYNRPVILLSLGEDGVARGSARSVAGCDITEAIGAQSHLLLGYGGHTMAAGMSLKIDDLGDFRQALSTRVRQMIGPRPKDPTIEIGGYLNLSEITLDLLADIDRLAPFGAGNPPLIFATRGLRIVEQTKIGRTGDHVRLVVEDAQGVTVRVLWWNGGEEPLPGGRFDLAFIARATTYKGQRQVQIEWVDARPIDEAVQVGGRAVYEVIDHRDASDALSMLQAIMTQEPNVQIWAEVETLTDYGGLTREQLKSTNALAIWTIPPSASELLRVLEQVKPKRVYLFNHDPQLDQVEPFMMRLGRLVNHVLNQRGGQVTLSALAAAMSQREATIRAGLMYWVFRREINLTYVDSQTLRIERLQGPYKEDLVRLDTLKALLSETQAYRSHFKLARAESLVQ